MSEKKCTELCGTRCHILMNSIAKTDKCADWKDCYYKQLQQLKEKTIFIDIDKEYPCSKEVYKLFIDTVHKANELCSSDTQKLLKIINLERQFKDIEFHVVNAHELLDNKKDEDGRYDLDDLCIGIEKLQDKNTIQGEALEIALLGLKRLADVSDDFVYARAFYCCEFAQGIVNRVNETLKKGEGESHGNNQM